MAKDKSPSSSSMVENFVSLIVSIFATALILGILFPLMNDIGLSPLIEIAPEAAGVINAIPLVIVLGFIIAVVFALVNIMRPK